MTGSRPSSRRHRALDPRSPILAPVACLAQRLLTELPVTSTDPELCLDGSRALPGRHRIRPKTDGVGIGAVVGWCVGAVVCGLAAKGLISSGLPSVIGMGALTNVLIGGGAGGIMGAVGGAMTARVCSFVVSRRKSARDVPHPFLALPSEPTSAVPDLPPAESSSGVLLPTDHPRV